MCSVVGISWRGLKTTADRPYTWNFLFVNVSSPYRPETQNKGRLLKWYPFFDEKEI